MVRMAGCAKSGRMPGVARIVAWIVACPIVRSQMFHVKHWGGEEAGRMKCPPWDTGRSVPEALGTRDLAPGTRDPAPETWHPAPETWTVSAGRSTEMFHVKHVL